VTRPTQTFTLHDDLPPVLSSLFRGLLFYGTPNDSRRSRLQPFGSEFVALKIATEQLEGLRYRLRMMGIPLQGTANTFCDNGSVVNNVTDSTSTLTKKHNALAYHKVRETVAAGTQRIAHEFGRFNLSDVLTKNLPVYKHKACCSSILH